MLLQRSYNVNDRVRRTNLLLSRKSAIITVVTLVLCALVEVQAQIPPALYQSASLDPTLEGNTFVRLGTVTPTTGPNSIQAGAIVSFPIIYGNRDTVRYHVSNGFIIYSDADGIPGDGSPGSRGTGTATWAHATGDGGNYKAFSPDVNGLWLDTTGFYPKSDFGGMYKFNCFGCDGAGADTVAFGGLANEPSQRAAHPMDSGAFFVIKILTKLSDTGKFICIDSATNYPPTNTWKWAVFDYQPAYNSIPTWSGARCYRLTACPSCDGASSAGQATLTDSSGYLLVGNIGSSGNDGVTIAYPDLGPLTALAMNFQGLSLDGVGKGVSFTAHVEGSPAGNANRAGSTSEYQSQEKLFTVSLDGASSDAVTVAADFSSIGDDTPLIEVYSNGAFQDSVSVTGGGTVASGTSVGGGSMSNTNTAVFANGKVTVKFTLDKPANFSTSHGPLATGNEMHLIAVPVPLENQRYSRFDVLPKGIGSFVVYGIEKTAGCRCTSTVGNVDCSPDDRVDISDLTELIDNLYVSLEKFCCDVEANIDGSTDGKADIADLTLLVDNLYITFTPLIQCP